MIRKTILLSLALASFPATAKGPAQIGQSARYRCGDGRAIDVLYGGGVAVLSIGPATAQMQRAPSPEGERYVGGGWQWSVTGRRSGVLARLAPGTDAASGGTNCTAQ